MSFQLSSFDSCSSAVSARSPAFSNYFPAHVWFNLSGTASTLLAPPTSICKLLATPLARLFENLSCESSMTDEFYLSCVFWVTERFDALELAARSEMMWWRSLL